MADDFSCVGSYRSSKIIISQLKLAFYGFPFPCPSLSIYEMIVNPQNSLDSSSKSVNETVDGSHHFTIRGYSLAKGMGPGKYILSETFSVGGYECVIYFYPDRKNVEDSSLYVSVFVALASEGTDVRALFELTLMDQSGKGKRKLHSHFDRALESGPYTLKYRGSMWTVVVHHAVAWAAVHLCITK